MRNRYVVWLSLYFLATTAGAATTEQGQCEPWAAKIVSIQGTVEARRNPSNDWISVSINNTYCSGDSIRVGSNSRAAIVLANETLLRLDQNSAITLSAVSKDSASLLDILTGLVHFISRVPHSLKANTPFVNAAIEGTEFVVAVSETQTTVTVFEGTVLAQNTNGEVRLTHNEAASARANEAPQKILLAKPRDAVQWALYYPPILPNTDPLFPIADLLYHGRVSEALSQIQQQRGQNSDQGVLDAFEAIIAVVQNDEIRALQLANQAVKQSPQRAATHIALSYAQQAQFDLDGATQSAHQAVRAEPGNALAYARLAELQLSTGYRRDALASAHRAVELDPQQSRAKTMLGFAYLTQIKIGLARETFNVAITLDQADPLPHLGLGLAMIRRNELAQGRREIEIAATLDPNNALIRSYLGKAYFEEKRPRIDADQFSMAKELDPNDPTPWFYDAIRKYSENRPVEALQDVQKSIELNDNRAVYRSQLQLDQDEAVRNVSQARIYNALGFEQQALTEATKSLALNPANHSAHRFLAESYAKLPRHEIARSSELLQSQLLQPLSITPFQAGLTEANLNTQYSGPASSAFNEYQSLFTRHGSYLSTSIVSGNNNTKGDELIFSGLYDRISFSLGQYSYNTDGYRDRANVNHDISSAFVQIKIFNDLDVQFELRNRRTQQGDLRQDFNPHFVPTDQRSLDEDTKRFGIHYQVTPRSDFLFSFIRNTRDSFSLRLTPPSLVRTSGILYSNDTQTQYLYHGDSVNLVAGASISDIYGNSLTALSPNGITFINTPSVPLIDQYNYYIYSGMNTGSLNITLGVSYDSYESRAPNREFDEIDPKFGLVWEMSKNTKLRIAAYQALKRSLTANQTLEPTHIAGFNQFFDDVNGSKIYAFGSALDIHANRNVFYGFEYFRRDLQVPETSGSSVRYNTQNQDQYKTLLNWTLSPNWVVDAQYVFEKFNNETKNPKEIKTISVPVAIRYFSPTGISTRLTATHVKQSNVFPATVPYNQREEDFTLLDFGLTYRLPKHYGELALDITNLQDRNFLYQDYYLFSGDSYNYTPRYLPSRGVVGRITLNF